MKLPMSMVSCGTRFACDCDTTLLLVLLLDDIKLKGNEIFRQVVFQRDQATTVVRCQCACERRDENRVGQRTVVA